MRSLLSLLVPAALLAATRRIIWTGSEAAAITRGSGAEDGRYACGVDDGRLIVRQLPSGSAVAISRADGPRIGRCLISPDSESIVYTDRGEGDADEIRIVPRASGEARLLFRDPKNPRLTLGRWASDAGSWDLET